MTKNAFAKHERMPSKEELGSLTDKIKEYDDLMFEAGHLDAQLKEKMARINDITLKEIPEMFSDIGLSSFTLEDGRKVKVAPQVSASITKANKEQAFEWLREKGHGDLIKEVVTISVHPQTLKAFVREQLGKQVVFPENLFSIFEFSKTTIK